MAMAQVSVSKRMARPNPCLSLICISGTATARMKDGGDCDLLDRLAGEPSFGLSRGDMERLLNPELYTGRCAQQVEDFVQSIRPLFADLERETARIEL